MWNEAEGVGVSCLCIYPLLLPDTRRAPGIRLQQNYPSRFRGRRTRLRGGRRAGDRVGTFGSRRSRTSHGSAGHVASGGSGSKNIVRPNLCGNQIPGVPTHRRDVLP